MPSGRIPDSRRADHELSQRVNVSLPPDMYKRLQAFCEAEDRPRSWVIQKAVDEWLEEKGF